MMTYDPHIMMCDCGVDLHSAFDGEAQQGIGLAVGFSWLCVAVGIPLLTGLTLTPRDLLGPVYRFSDWHYDLYL
jgi:hydrogenase maturation factor HypE